MCIESCRHNRAWARYGFFVTPPPLNETIFFWSLRMSSTWNGTLTVKILGCNTCFGHIYTGTHNSRESRLCLMNNFSHHFQTDWSLHLLAHINMLGINGKSILSCFIWHIICTCSFHMSDFMTSSVFLVTNEPLRQTHTNHQISIFYSHTKKVAIILLHL